MASAAEQPATDDGLAAADCRILAVDRHYEHRLESEDDELQTARRSTAQHTCAVERACSGEST